MHNNAYSPWWKVMNQGGWDDRSEAQPRRRLAAREGAPRDGVGQGAQGGGVRRPRRADPDGQGRDPPIEPRGRGDLDPDQRDQHGEEDLRRGWGAVRLGGGGNGGGGSRIPYGGRGAGVGELERKGGEGLGPPVGGGPDGVSA